MSRGLKADVTLVRRAESEYMQKHGQSPRLTQLAEMTGLTAERVQEAYQAADVLRNMQDMESMDVEYSRQLWEDHEERDIARIDLAEAVSSLEPKARQVIVLRYYKDFTQQQVADLMGISQVQVCRIEKKTLKSMAEKVSG